VYGYGKLSGYHSVILFVTKLKRIFGSCQVFLKTDEDHICTLRYYCTFTALKTPPFMDSIILILVCMLAGIFLRRQNFMPANAHVALNQFVIYLLIPALSLYYIPKIEISQKLLYPVGGVV
jgi:hypothetical protein